MVDKRIRKTLEKSGMVRDPISYSKVSIKFRQSFTLDYKDAEVYVSKSGRLRIILGTPTADDRSGALGDDVDFLKDAMSKVAEAGDLPDEDEGPPPLTDADETAKDAETGFMSGDIEMVIQQGGCSRAAAIDALTAASGDVVEAIMKVTEMNA